jgi:hypothetical protein
MASIFRTSVIARRRAVRKSPVLRLRTSSPEKPKASRRLGHFHRKNHVWPRRRRYEGTILASVDHRVDHRLPALGSDDLKR